ncbi:MAG: PAS domain S-box protein [Candidatus Binataceae bacterium]
MLPLDPKYLQRLVESSPDIIIAVDREGTIIYYNDGARQNLGFSSEEIIGQPCTRIYPTQDEARRVMRAMREASTPGRVSNFETQFLNKNGDIIPIAISGSLIHDDNGVEIGSIGFARDIRRLLQREQLATAGEIAVSLAHEINNPLESITNNLELLARCVEPNLSESEKVVENERLDSIRLSLERVQGIVRRLDEMTRKGVYETRDYLAGKKMADLSPREDPRADQAAAGPKPAQAVKSGSPLAGMSILVLDDDLTVVNSLGELLRTDGCVVHCATRPSAALGILRNVKVDAVISDVVMPEMDGYEFYLRVKEEMPSLPVILMTAFYYDKDHIMKRARLRGLEGALFKKPINPAKLRQLLAQLRQKAQVAKSSAAPAPKSEG